MHESIAQVRNQNHEQSRVNELIPDYTIPQSMRNSSTNLIKFLEEYYLYLNQTDKPSYELGHVIHENDLDFTSKEYLDSIQAEIATIVPNQSALNRNTLYKRIVHFYRTKGTIDSVDTFFRLFFPGSEATVEYGAEPWSYQVASTIPVINWYYSFKSMVHPVGLQFKAVFVIMIDFLFETNGQFTIPRGGEAFVELVRKLLIDTAYFTHQGTGWRGGRPLPAEPGMLIPLTQDFAVRVSDPVTYLNGILLDTTKQPSTGAVQTARFSANVDELPIPATSSDGDGTFLFDGINDYVYTTGLTEASFITDWTLAFWYKGAQPTNITSGLIIQTPISPADPIPSSLALFQGRLTFLGPDGLDGDDRHQTITAINDDQWHHCAMVVRGTSGPVIAKLYVDGKLESTDTIEDITSDGGVFSFARLMSGVTSTGAFGGSLAFTRGSMRDFRVYSTAALSDADIFNLSRPLHWQNGADINRFLDADLGNITDPNREVSLRGSILCDYAAPIKFYDTGKLKTFGSIRLDQLINPIGGTIYSPDNPFYMHNISASISIRTSPAGQFYDQDLDPEARLNPTDPLKQHLDSPTMYPDTQSAISHP